MSQTIEQAEEFRSKAISILLAERQQIDNTLASLSTARRNRNPRSTTARREPRRTGGDFLFLHKCKPQNVTHSMPSA